MTESAEFPASAWQRHYWQEAKLARGGVALNVAMRWQIEGRVSDASIERALQTVVARHEVLRTRFAQTGSDGLVQHVEPAIAFKLALIDLQRLPEDSRAAEAQQIGLEEARKPFDLAKAPLLRALLVRLDGERAILHLTFHHLIVDGWSIGIIIREFGTLAAAFDSAEAASLPEVDLHYGDYALWQQETLRSGALDGERDYWLAKLEGLPRFEVEPDHPRAAEGASPGEIRSVLLPRALTDAVEALAQRQGHTLFSLAVASLATTLHRVTGVAEVVIGTQVAGREGVEAERIVGPLLNALVLRLDARGNPPFAGFAEGIRDTIREAMAHQRLPFGLLNTLAGQPADPARHPLYAINFVLQKAYIDTAKTSDDNYGRFKLKSLPSHSAGALWDLNFFMVGRDEGWRISCEVNTALYDVASADAILAQWKRVLEAIVADDAARLSALLPLEEIERRPAVTPRPAPLRIAASPSVAAPTRPTAHNPRLAALRDRILQLQPKGHQTPVIAINNTAVFYPLAREFGESRPFIDIQFCPSSTPQNLPPRDFRDIARDAVEMIRLARPNGPYILMGLCVFGAVALEAAQQLRREGEDVPLVILNDTWAPGYREDMPWRDRHTRAWQVRKRNVTSDWRRYRSGQMTLTLFLSSYTLLRKTGLIRAALALKLLKPNPQGDVLSIENRWFTDYLRESQARYRPAPYDGDVIIFRSEETMHGRLFDHALGWRRSITGKIEVFPCPGMHAEMFREAGAKVIARDAKAVLARIEGDRG